MNSSGYSSILAVGVTTICWQCVVVYFCLCDYILHYILLKDTICTELLTDNEFLFKNTFSFVSVFDCMIPTFIMPYGNIRTTSTKLISGDVIVIVMKSMRGLLYDFAYVLCFHTVYNTCKAHWYCVMLTVCIFYPTLRTPGRRSKYTPYYCACLYLYYLHCCTLSTSAYSPCSIDSYCRFKCAEISDITFKC